ncbi:MULTISPECIES: hypothetical protein [Sphingobacterium]|uniref:hypothetical protein n=1 Tax=Sphingobacterium TaxID=28453 RepID=UPI0010476371|nr:MULTISPECIES: hypothetical protein [Sphingobacterium]MCW2260160.1 hypothetical protein [Sphingobacterium kitahiroshimense]TCR11049.1 hypothetical protein EDF67_104142 [Sphingobacterium sp. JUb78]
MKKYLLLCIALLAALPAICQMSDLGYKKLKLGMAVQEAREVINFRLKDDIAKVIYEGVPLELSFQESEGRLQLWVITSSSPLVRLSGIETTLIGKNYKQVKALLGNKLVAIDMEGPSKTHFKYYVNRKSIENEYTSCILEFNDKGILHNMMSVFNP